MLKIALKSLEKYLLISIALGLNLNDNGNPDEE